MTIKYQLYDDGDAFYSAEYGDYNLVSKLLQSTELYLNWYNVALF